MAIRAAAESTCRLLTRRINSNDTDVGFVSLLAAIFAADAEFNWMLKVYLLIPNLSFHPLSRLRDQM